MSNPRCPYCRHAFGTEAALAAHAPCPDRLTGDRPGDPTPARQPLSTVDVARVERWWLFTWAVTTTYTERVTAAELWHDLPASTWRRFGEAERFDPAEVDPAVLLELLRRFETEYTADPITERSLRTAERTTDPDQDPDPDGDGDGVDGGEPR